MWHVLWESNRKEHTHGQTRHIQSHPHPRGTQRIEGHRQQRLPHRAQGPVCQGIAAAGSRRVRRGAMERRGRVHRRRVFRADPRPHEATLRGKGSGCRPRTQGTRNAPAGRQVRRSFRGRSHPHCLFGPSRGASPVDPTAAPRPSDRHGCRRHGLGHDLVQHPKKTRSNRT